MVNFAQQAAKWAFDLIQTGEFCILDTETTGLKGDAEICQIAVIDSKGVPRLHSLVKPTIPISAEATAIHGITDATVASAPSFEEILLPLLKAMGKQNVVIYNAEFDLRLIRQSIKPYGIQLAFPHSDRRQCRIFLNGGSILDAMLWYAQWVGESGAHGDFRWQKLPDASHTALGDCQAVLRVLHRMAESYQPVDPCPDPDVAGEKP